MDVSFLEPVFAATGPVRHGLRRRHAHHRERRHRARPAGPRDRRPADRAGRAGAPSSRRSAAGCSRGTRAGRRAPCGAGPSSSAADGTVVLDQALVDAPPREVAEWSPQPDLLPVLRQLPGRVPHIVVLADRVGADITYMGAPGQAEEEETVEGDAFQIQQGPGRRLGAPPLPAQRREQVGAQRRRGRRADLLDGPAAVAAVRARRRRRPGPADPHRPGQRRVVGPGRLHGRGRPRRRRRPRAGRPARCTSWSPSTRPARAPRCSSRSRPPAPTAWRSPAPRRVVEALRKGQVETLVLADEPDDEHAAGRRLAAGAGRRPAGHGRPRHPRRGRARRPGAAGRRGGDQRRRRRRAAASAHAGRRARGRRPALHRRPATDRPAP